MIFDSEFVISLGRTPRSSARQRAVDFLRAHRPAALYVSRITVCEVSTGFEHRTDAETLLTSFTTLEIDAEVGWMASRIARDLQGKGLHIGDNDVWIAATALRHGLPLVSNNAKHLDRVKGLDLRGY